MKTSSISIPSGLPRLSRGRHRSPRSGTCFMEFASYLAGEPWSDHPECTDPLLAQLARCVNDAVDDEHRDALLPLVPRVVGLRGRDDELAAVIAYRAAAAAVPVASMGRQHALAGALLALEPLLPPSAGDELRRAARDALEAAPHALRWADEHTMAVHPRDLIRRGTVAIVHTAVTGIAEACIEDPDGRLVDLLSAAIADAEAVLGRSARDAAAQDAASRDGSVATIAASSSRAGVSDTLVTRVP